MKRGIVTVVVAALALMFAGNAVAVRQLDYAAEDAGYEVIKAMSHRKLVVGRIAVLPLFGDRDNLTPIVKAEMTRYSGIYEFYERDEEDWNKLVGEIEFGDRRSDIMAQETIQKFGKIKGVEALLYGDVREATTQGSSGAIVRLTIKLANVQTGQVLWSANIEGVYRGALVIPPKLVAAAARDAASKAAASLATAKAALGKLNVYLMPMNAQNTRLSDYVSPEFINVGDANIRFFTGVADQTGQRIVNKMASELSSAGGAAISDLSRISRQLEQLFEKKPGIGGTEVARDAVLYGHFGAMTSDNNMATIVLNMHLADLRSGQVLWAGTTDGRAVIAAEDISYRYLRQYWRYILIGFGILVVLGFFYRMTRRVR